MRRTKLVISVIIISFIFFIAFNYSGCRVAGRAPAQWTGTKQFGTAGYDYATGVATDSNGNIYVAGYTEGGLDGITFDGFGDLFVAKYNASGEKQWTRQLGPATYDYATGVATDTGGNIYVTGYTFGGLDGNTNAGSWDAFVVKYNSAGQKQ